jgi:hypothetical protein
MSHKKLLAQISLPMLSCHFLVLFPRILYENDSTISRGFLWFIMVGDLKVTLTRSVGKLFTQKHCPAPMLSSHFFLWEKSLSKVIVKVEAVNSQPCFTCSTKVYNTFKYSIGDNPSVRYQQHEQQFTNSQILKPWFNFSRFPCIIII